MEEQKTSKTQSVVNAITSIVNIGDPENDKVIAWIKKQTARLKHIIALEIMLLFVVGLPSYVGYKIKRGEIDELAEVAIQVMPSFEEQEKPQEENPICPKCNGDNTRLSSVDGSYWCNDCLIYFSKEVKNANTSN